MPLLPLLALLLLGAIWGASFLFIGLAVPQLGPLPLMFARTALAGLALVGAATLLRRPTAYQWRAHWRPYLVVGLLNSALPFSLIAFSELTLPVSLAAILNATTPLFTALLATWGSQERVTGRIALGAVLGLVGVVVLMSGAPLALDGTIGIAVLASLVAAFCYGAGTVYAARRMAHLTALEASTVQLLSAAAILAAPAALTLPARWPTLLAVGALLALTLLSTCVAYLLYFYLLQQVGPTRTATVTFLVPLFGTLWGLLIMGEPFTSGMGLGMVIILASVSLILRRRTQATPVSLPPGTAARDEPSTEAIGSVLPGVHRVGVTDDL